MKRIENLSLPCALVLVLFFLLATSTFAFSLLQGKIILSEKGRLSVDVWDTPPLKLGQLVDLDQYVKQIPHPFGRAEVIRIDGTIVTFKMLAGTIPTGNGISVRITLAKNDTSKPSKNTPAASPRLDVSGMGEKPESFSDVVDKALKNAPSFSDYMAALKNRKELRGKVTAFKAGEPLTVEVLGETLPKVGDAAETIAFIPDEGEKTHGTWTVSKIDKKQVICTPVKAPIPAFRGQAVRFPAIQATPAKPNKDSSKIGTTSPKNKLFELPKTTKQGEAIYQQGIAFEKKGNFTEAARCYRTAAQMEHAGGQNMLGWYTQNGKGGITANQGEALKWYRLADAQGHLRGTTNLAWFYLHGLGVKKDPKRAGELYQKGAAAGDPLSKGNLGHLKMNGIGTPKDCAGAVPLIREAAEKNINFSMFTMGLLCKEGKFVPRDLAASRRWFERALAAGITGAQKELDKLPPADNPKQ